MKFALRWVVVVCLIALPTASAFAQGANTKATLTGVVQDASGGVVPGASVTIRNVATGVTNETVSNETGNFAVAALDTGTYEATVSLAGFKTFKVDKIVLTPGATANVTAKLEVGGAEESITVVARSELIDTTSTTVSSTISADQIQSLPVVTKSAMQIVTFLPGINSRQLAHAAQLDGARAAAERDRHRHRRRQHPGSERQVDRRLLSRHPAAERSRRAGQRRGSDRDG